MATPPEILWQPSDQTIAGANLTAYLGWLRKTKRLDFPDYQSLWTWSVTEIERFWASIWDYFDIIASAPYTEVLPDRFMPGANWFPGARLNYAENIFRRAERSGTAILYRTESGSGVEVSWEELHTQTAKLAAAFRDLGVGKGDRVVAYLPNIPETVAAFLAAASLGAIWSSCPPDFGDRSVLDRFIQIEPKLLLAVDGYRWAGKSFDRMAVVEKMRAGLPTLDHTILIPRLDPGRLAPPGVTKWDDLLATAPVADLAFEQVPFGHPLWVLYSSGTTGLPKPIVHGHGGILLEHLKTTHLHLDLKPEDRFFWFTSTGWMMWNFLLGGLLNGTPVVLYDGAPNYPDLNALWKLAEQTGITYFGTGAAFIHGCMQAGIEPKRDFDLGRIRALGSTGSPLSMDGFRWVYKHVNPDLALESFSGGTDLCTGFIGGVRTQPIYAGELQSPLLGAKIQAFDEAGEPVVGAVGELVISEPMPSMPLHFWNDPGMERYMESYFGMYPGVWRHGDWISINERNGCVIYGRSDATINRQGVRMGTSEIYRVVEAFEEVIDSLVIDLEFLEGESYLPLFVVLQEGVLLDDNLVSRIKARLRAEVSPRHVPDEVIQIEEVPYTLSGKKMEVPVRKILLGRSVEEAANVGAMRNPGALGYFVELALRPGK
ncbi:MAG TPA: acetoacetate--CoA ligase [Anaerolineales bacterium]|nr:acetoacetate--CoA ligase [Anaerolineales bacterium]